MQQIISLIKKVRENKEISKGQLALKTGIDRAYLSKIESGKVSPGSEIIEKIFDALGIDINQPLPSGVREVPVVGVVSA